MNGLGVNSLLPENKLLDAQSLGDEKVAIMQSEMNIVDPRVQCTDHNMDQDWCAVWRREKAKILDRKVMSHNNNMMPFLKKELKAIDLKSLSADNQVLEAFCQDLSIDIQILQASSQLAEKMTRDLVHAALLDLRLPATIDRTSQPRCDVGDGVTIVIVSASSGAEGLTALFEGNRQYPGAVMFAFSPFWLSRQPSPTDPTTETLYVHKALTADAGGQTFLDVFTPPRRVTYVVNHTYEYFADDVIGQAGKRLTDMGLDTPMSSSMPISLRTDDKLLTRTACAARDVGHPVSLGFWLPGESSPRYPDHHPTIGVVRLPSQDVRAEDVEPDVRKFLDSELMRNILKVVVKPFGVSGWWGSKGVTIHQASEVKDIVSAILDLVTQIAPGEGILVDSFHKMFDPLPDSEIGRFAQSEGNWLGSRLRVVVTRTPLDGARMAQIVAGINDTRTPINGNNSIPLSLELMLHKWGVTDVTHQKEIRDVIQRSSERLLLELMDRERRLTVKERGGVDAQLDMIGLDVILSKINGVITPVVIEVNGQDCVCLPFCYEATNPNLRGEAVGGWVQTMVSRSQRFLMRNKVVLMIGGGGFTKRNLWSAAKDFGVKVVLVDSDPNNLAKGQVAQFLHVEYEDHTRDHEHADAIAKLVRAEVGHVDGCLTVRDDCIPLTSLVAERLQLPFTPPYHAAVVVKSKGLTHTHLFADKWEPVHAMHVALYASPVARITGLQDVDRAIKQVPLPAILKFEYGSSGAGIRRVISREEVAEHIQLIPKTLLHIDGISHGGCMVLMPRLVGSEHDVELVMFEGKLQAAFVVDMGPTTPPLCLQMIAALPSTLCDEYQQQLITASVACCRSIGLVTGVFCVRMMLTPCGPKLLEINARMGGGYTQDFIRRIYDVDLFHLAMMAACGVRPVAANSLVDGLSTAKAREDKGQLIGLMLYAGRHGNALASTATPEHLKRLHDVGSVILDQFGETVDGGPHEYEVPFACLTVHAPTLREARAKFVATCLALGLESQETLAELLRDVPTCCDQ